MKIKQNLKSSNNPALSIVKTYSLNPKRRRKFWSLLLWKAGSRRALQYWFLLFTMIVTAIGSLIVILALSKPSDVLCDRQFKYTVPRKAGSDSNPRSVVIGDVNNDSQLDIIVANYGMDNVGLFLGVGNMIFNSQETLPTGFDSRPISVTVADFDNDMNLDIAVANYGTNSLGLFFGHGNATFAQYSIIELGQSRPWSLLAHDLNKDRYIDLVVVSYGTNTANILLGNHDTTFVGQWAYPTGYDSYPSALAVGDLNNDDHLDIVIANYGTSNLGLLLGYGDGTFYQQITYVLAHGSNPFGIFINDFNSDQLLDIVLANSGGNCIAILFGLGNGSFTRPKTFSTGEGSQPTQVAVAYVNDDDLIDIIVSNYGSDEVGVFLGDEDNIFKIQRAFRTELHSQPYAMAIADLNGDNRSDIIVTNRGSSEILILSLYENFISTKLISYQINIPSTFEFLVTADLNNDKILDALLGYTTGFFVFLGVGNGKFGQKMEYSTGLRYYITGIHVYDLNDDGQLDLLCFFGETDRVVLFRGYGNGTFSKIKSMHIDGCRRTQLAKTIGDFNGDNRTDVIIICDDFDFIIIHFGDNNGSFPRRTIFWTDTSSYTFPAAAGDFNGDKCTDIVFTDSLNSSFVVYIGLCDGTFTNRFTYYYADHDLFPYSIKPADLNNDSYLDLIVTFSGNGTINIFYGFGNGTFEKRISYEIIYQWTPSFISVGDFNDDQFVDIIFDFYSCIGIMFGTKSELSWILNKCFISTEFLLWTANIADFNNDHFLDICAMIDGKSGFGILLTNISANFHVTSSYSTGSIIHPVSIAISDFNTNGYLDIVVASGFHKNIKVLLDYNNGSFEEERTYFIGLRSFPEYTAVDYINTDEILDIIIVDPLNDIVSIFIGYGNGSFNKPLNQPQHNNSKPRSACFGNFNNDDWIDAAIANVGKDNIMIQLGFPEPTFQYSQMYRTRHTIWESSIISGDFNNDNRMDVIVSNGYYSSITTFLGNGDGTFESEILSLTKNSWSQSLTNAADFSNDCFLDLLMVNEYNISVFLGFGNGSFAELATYSIEQHMLELSVGIADINGDNHLDLAVISSSTNQIYVFYGYGNGEFEKHRSLSISFGFIPKSVTLADLNDDGRIDVIVGASGLVGILYGYGNWTFKNIVRYSIPYMEHLSYIAVHDFNADNRLDIVSMQYYPVRIGVFYAAINDSFVYKEVSYIGDYFGTKSVIITDLNSDQRLDFIVKTVQTHDAFIYYGMSGDTFTSAKSFISEIQFSFNSMTVVDLNGDRYQDFVLTDVQTQSIHVYLCDNIKFFKNTRTYSTGKGSQPCSVVGGDLNNDNQVDIVVANNGTNNLGVFLGYPNGTFGTMQHFSTGPDSQPSAIQLAHLNNDTVLDIIVANSNANNIGILLGYGDGSFADIVTYSTGENSHPLSIAVTDFNNDNTSDIVVANSATNNLLILLGKGDGTFTFDSIIKMPYQAQPVFVTVGDFNRDTWMDLAVVNYGLGSVDIILKQC